MVWSLPFDDYDDDLFLHYPDMVTLLGPSLPYVVPVTKMLKCFEHWVGAAGHCPQRNIFWRPLLRRAWTTQVALGPHTFLPQTLIAGSWGALVVLIGLI